VGVEHVVPEDSDVEEVVMLFVVDHHAVAIFGVEHH
jgi:hypothetical protein